MPDKDRERVLELRTVPILGTKTDVPANHPSMFKAVGENTVLTHDAGGQNFDLSRNRGTCMKSNGYAQWSNSANATATNCLGLFELYDGTNRNHIYIDAGDVFIYDGSLDPAEKKDAGNTAFASDNVDLYSMIRIGAYWVFADRAEHTPYKWKHGDATLSKLCASGTEYKFRYLVSFMRRVIGLYSDQTDGNIDIRYSTAWPSTAIASLNFPATNQLYVPNDDTLTGGATMGADRCFLYCEDSIQQLAHYGSYTTPFVPHTVVPHQGAVNHHCIVPFGDRHLIFNKNYGFCDYRGGNQFHGAPISDDIEPLISSINPTYYNLIVGCADPINRRAVWTVPLYASPTPTHLLFYNLDTGQWTVEPREMRYVDFWRLDTSFTWNDLITALGGTGATWAMAGNSRWADYSSTNKKLAYSEADGQLYYHTGEGLNGSSLDGFRIEPIMDFGDAKRKDTLDEIWFDLAAAGDFPIVIHHRSGTTVGEVESAGWELMPSLSHNAPLLPFVKIQRTASLHQVKWGTIAKDQQFMVSGITYRYHPKRVH